MARNVTAQELSDCGLNPFAVQLLLESYKAHPRPIPVAFFARDVCISIGHDVPGLLEHYKQVRNALFVALGEHCNDTRQHCEEIMREADAVIALMEGTEKTAQQNQGK